MKRFVVPVLNAVVTGLLFGLFGYYLGDLTRWAFMGIVSGFAVGGFIELILRRGPQWIYRRRFGSYAVMVQR
jgi:hypothetical protein